MARVIFHVDMDAFYASVEQRDRPELAGKPVIVGGPPTQRGVVCAASYEARKFGVRSAMPSITAGRLCPQGVFIYPRMDQYRDESERIMSILKSSGASIEQVSVDEAYLELGQLNQPEAGAEETDQALYAAVPLARGLKQQILTERKLTASIGIAHNKFLAKLGSDLQKPDGLTVIPEREKIALLRPMPVRVIHGVGPVTERVLASAGIATIAELQDYGGELGELVGSFAQSLRDFAFGRDPRPLDLSEVVKSISSEETFPQDTEDRPTLRTCMRSQAAEISRKLQERQLGAHTVQVKVRYGDFKTLTRQITVEEPLNQADEIYRLGCFLLARDQLVCRPLRLLGLGVSGLGDAARRQLQLL